ncbi:alpha/beta hydrolase family protein [Rhizobium sp. C4]|uniref:alpha/beta hydrolase family protein n=1 Tax=Rhizobium sp. C4 TaxID=1349800 RepID=UPI001E405A80|nr:dienelactone hydrolase [Rhizobium sp. C4]MCD2175375.1 dienelactone hydrolase [Rhizobium sp. C4]
MTPRPLTLLIAATTLLASFPAAAFEAGTEWITITPPHRGAKEGVLLTYPAQADGDAYTLGADELWTGVPARRNANPVAEKFPLVVLSHGSGGNAASLGWLSTELARNGFIVAAPNHIHSTSGDSLPVESIKIWERSQDISALLDSLLADPRWSKLIDKDRIGAIGFSLGGTSVMLAAGARASLSTFADYCKNADGKDGGCNWFLRGGADLSKLDRNAFDGSYRDPRLSALVAVDPGFAMAYQPDSLKAMTLPTLFVNMGEGESIMPGVRAEPLARQVPGAAYAAIPGAIHFTFLGVCNPSGADVLKRYGEEDPVCDDGGDTPRVELHKQIFFKIAVFLRKNLQEK